MKDWSLYLLLFASCVGFSFLFSGMEAGVFALNRWRIRQLMREGKRPAALLNRYLEQSETFLWTILIGNSLTAVAAITLVAYVLYKWLPTHPIAMLLIFMVVVFLFYAVADLLPKMLFRIYPNPLCMAMARPFRLIHLILSPLVAVIEALSKILLKWTGGRAFRGQFFSSRNELRLAIQESGQAFSSEEKGMINRVLDLQTRTLREIMLPFNRVTTVTTDMTLDQIFAIYREYPRNYLPVWDTEGPARRIAGILNAKQIIYSSNPESKTRVADVLKPALYLNLDVRIEYALQRMQRSGQRMAIVAGYDQRELGVVTLEEILKIIFGEVRL